DAPAGLQHPRAGHVPDGGQPEDQRAQQVEPEPRHQEPVRCRWQQLRYRGLAKSDAYDPVFVDARIGIPRRTDARGKSVRLRGASFLAFSAVCCIRETTSTKTLRQVAPSPPQQPIPFSHKMHAGNLQLQCKGCHPNPDPGEMMRIAPPSTCMACHSAIKTDSPAVQKLAAFAKED